MWASMQGKFWEAIVPTEYTVAATAAIAREAKRVEYLNPTGDVSRIQHFDTDLLDYVDAELENGSAKKMMVLHTAGAHFHYASHYPSRHEHYQPVCTKNRPRECEPESLNNAYDNAMHFVDEFLGKLADRLKDRRAIVFYVSDHGESLGEGGKFLHHLDSAEPEQNRVAMLVWASEKFKTSRDPQWRKLLQNRHLKLGHEHAFHSILDCVGITSPVIDRSLSVCSEVRERTDQLPPNRLSIQF
jgi:KDO II ethanolaminephosphotransferase